MPTYIGLVKYEDKDEEAELMVGRAARQLVEVHGGADSEHILDGGRLSVDHCL